MSSAQLHRYILLLRGINVGGKNRLPMKDLRAILESLGYRDVTTYIQSGNAVFRSESEDPTRLGERITSTIDDSFGFHAPAMVLTTDRLESAIADNPFPQADDDPKSLHLWFLASEPQDPDLESIENARAPSERFSFQGRTCYLYAPDGFGYSKLGMNAEKWLGVPATARNWRTVRKLQELVGKEG